MRRSIVYRGGIPMCCLHIPSCTGLQSQALSHCVAVDMYPWNRVVRNPRWLFRSRCPGFPNEVNLTNEVSGYAKVGS